MAHSTVVLMKDELHPELSGTWYHFGKSWSLLKTSKKLPMSAFDRLWIMLLTNHCFSWTPCKPLTTAVGYSHLLVATLKEKQNPPSIKIDRKLSTPRNHKSSAEQTKNTSVYFFWRVRTVHLSPTYHPPKTNPRTNMPTAQRFYPDWFCFLP